MEFLDEFLKESQKECSGVLKKNLVKILTETSKRIFGVILEEARQKLDKIY